MSTPLVIQAGAPQTAWEVLMAGTTISSVSTQYVLVPVRAWNQGQPYNPTALPVAIAFIDGWGKPTEEDWNPDESSWASTSTVNGYYQAQCLVGPGEDAVDLAVGAWNMWIQVTGDPEIPEIVCGTLTIT